MAQRNRIGQPSRVAVRRAGVSLKHACGYPNARGRRWVARTVGGGRHAECATEARRERADAAQPDSEADVRDRAVGVAKERGGALEPTGQEVLVWRLAECAPELAAEVSRREARRARKLGHVERFAVAGVDQVLGTKEVACGRDRRNHRPSIASSSAPTAARWHDARARESGRRRSSSPVRCARVPGLRARGGESRG